MVKKIVSIILVLSMLMTTTSCQTQTSSVEEQANAWLVGEAVPEEFLGTAGDMYLDTQTYDIYLKNSDAWENIGNIRMSVSEDETNENGKVPVFQMNGQDLQWKYEGDSEWTTLYSFEHTVSELSWLVGSKTPDASYGNSGDMYVNTETYDLYQKNGNSWDLVCNIKNDEKPASIVEKGEKGEDGKTPIFQMDGQMLQWKYTDEDTFKDLIEIKNGANGTDGRSGSSGSDGKNGKDGANGVDGKDGKDGTNWFIGSGEPGSGIAAKEGDLYLDSETSNVYKYSNSVWTSEVTIKSGSGEKGVDGKTPVFQMNGQKLQWKYTDEDTFKDLIEIVNGADGKDGKDGADGKDGKDGADGKDGKDGADGANGTNGKDGADGTNGTNGKDGTDGTDGKDGSVWFIGSGEPGSGITAKASDLYLDSATSNVYRYSGSAWSLEVNIKGEKGDKGDKGDAGENGKTPVLQMSGQKLQWKYSDEEDFKDLIEVVNGTNGKDGADGKDGTDGAAGKDGSIWFTGSGEPGTGIVAKTGDLYLDSDAGDIYKYSGTSWTLEANIKGNQGNKGDAGKDGTDGKDGKDGTDGADGKTPEFRMNNRMLQWKYTDSSTWIDLIEIGAGDSSGEAKAKPVIFDTDFWTDTDDLSAIRILLWAEQEGMCDIVGMIVDAVNSKSGQAVSRYLDYEGRGDLPVALEKAASDFNGSPCYFDTMINNWSYGLYNSNDDAEDENAGEYYIKLLNNVPDGEKCNIICVGYLTALAGLMNRAESDESVMELVKNKVDKIYIMAGNYPSGSENNITRTARSRQAGYDAISKTPECIDLIFLGYEAGVSVKSGNKTGAEIGDFDLLYKAMVAHGNGTNANSSWDPMTVLLAVYDDADAAGYKLVRGTNTINSGTGANTFTANETGHHYYVTKKYPDGWYAHQIDSILARNAWPHRETGRVQYNPGQEDYTLTGITIKTAPTKTTYYVGETFSSAGMVVSASLTGTESGNTKTENIYSYTISQTDPFAEAGNQTVTVSYTLGGVTKTADVYVTVVAPQTFSVAVSTTNGTNSELATIKQGKTEEITITPDQGYDLPETITVEGAEYTYNDTTGKITLSAPTANVTVTVECVQLVSRTISVTVANGEYSGPDSMTKNAEITVTADEGYELPANISVTGASHTWNSTTGVIALSSPTGNVVISVTCKSEEDSSFITVELDGSENWAFNNENEPNINGFYNCYLIDSAIVPENAELALASGIPTQAYCSWGSDWKCNDATGSAAQTEKCFGYYAADPSIYFRFQSDVATSVDTFKQYLSEHPVTLYFLKAGKTAKTYSITGDIQNGSLTGASSIGSFGTANVTLVPDSGYSLPDSVTVTGATYTYNKTTGLISLSSPTANISISAECEEGEPAQDYSIDVTVENGSYVGPATATGTATITITADDGYSLPTTIEVDGANHTWNSTTGVISLTNITEDVTICVECEEEESDYIAVTLNGDENWAFNTSGEPNNKGYYNCYLIDSSIVPAAKDLSVNTNFRCTDAYCEGDTWTNQTANTDRSSQAEACFGYFSKDPSIYFRFTSEVATSVDTFKQYLSEHPVTLYFKKASN